MIILEWLYNKSMCKGKFYLKLDFLIKNFLGEDIINKYFIWIFFKKIIENVKLGNLWILVWFLGVVFGDFLFLSGRLYICCLIVGVVILFYWFVY